MRRQNKCSKILLAFFVVLALAVVVVCSVLTQNPSFSSSKAQKFDESCLIEVRQNPLKDCAR